MIEKKGIQAAEWLKTVRPEQNISKLAEVTRDKITGFKEWFMSRLIRNVLYLGYYDASTEKYVLGRGTQPISGTVDIDKILTNDVNVMKDVVTDTQDDVNTYEWTVPAGKQWIISHCSFKNDTDLCKPQLAITPSGGSETIVDSFKGTGCIAGQLYNAFRAGGTQGSGAFNGAELILDAGDKIKITDTNFTAGDTTQLTIVYVEV